MVKSRGRLTSIMAVLSALMLIILAVACNSGDNVAGTSIQGTGSGSIAGTVDNSIVSLSKATTESYEVWAKIGDTYVLQGTFTAASGDEDHAFSLNGLAENQVFTVELSKRIGFLRVPVLSSALSATTSSSKSRSKTLTNNQLNVATTYVAQKYNSLLSTDATTSLTTVVQGVFGSGVTSLSDVVMDNGKVTNTAGTGIPFADPLARSATTLLTLATVASVNMSTSDLATQFDSLTSLTSSLASATDISALVGQTSTISTLMSTALNTISNDTLDATLKSADPYTAGALGSTDIVSSLSTLSVTTLSVATLTIESVSLIASGSTPSTSFASTLSTISGISLTTLQTQASSLIASVGSSVGLSSSQISQAQESAGGVLNVNSFELAHATYGSKSGNDFDINTLSPVFKIVLNSELLNGSPSSFVSVSINGTSSSVGLGNLNDNSLIRTVTSDNKTYYLMVLKADSTSITSGKELSPGAQYTYSIKPLSGITLKFAGSETSEISGKINMRSITFTYAINSSNSDSLVDLGVQTYKGLSSTTPSFLIHAKSSIDQFNNTPSDYGVLSSLSISLKSSGTAVAALQSGTHISVSSASATAFKASVKTSAGLASGASYTLSVTSNGLTLSGSSVSSSDLPTEQSMKLQ